LGGLLIVDYYLQYNSPPSMSRLKPHFHDAGPYLKNRWNFKINSCIVDEMSKAIENLILCHPKDNVATASSPLNVGTFLRLAEQKTIVAREQIPFGHKIALQKIRKGGPVIKYGERIGKAIRKINPGEWVHIHNVVGERGRGSKR